jgi:hypothetical protein
MWILCKEVNMLTRIFFFCPEIFHFSWDWHKGQIYCIMFKCFPFPQSERKKHDFFFNFTVRSRNTLQFCSSFSARNFHLISFLNGTERFITSQGPRTWISLEWFISNYSFRSNCATSYRLEYWDIKPREHNTTRTKTFQRVLGVRACHFGISALHAFLTCAT